ncbi:Dabb family protein [Clostridia bacterium OttesenSCG-928-F22]|nr:Dabb family protein [Clostridia bacterium OttesenSCG-928-F22]
MVRHIVLWNYADGFTAKQNAQNAATAKERFEALKGKLPGIITLSVKILPLDGSSMDIMLDSTFETLQDLHNYQQHEEHEKIVAFMRTAFTGRQWIDFDME